MSQVSKIGEAILEKENYYHTILDEIATDKSIFPFPYLSALQNVCICPSF